MDPLRDSKRQNILSQIDRGSDLKILEMDDFIPKGSIGSGISSEVCLLVSKKDNKEFAGKFINSEISARDFINEVTILNSCSRCPTIVNLIGIMTTPKCLVLEYHVNGSLDIALQEDSKCVEQGMETEFPFLRKLGYIKDLCAAVNALHLQKICHRDIAMRNLLLSDDKKHVVLADFSLSRVINSGMETQSTFTAVLPLTSAPESLRKSYSLPNGYETFTRYYSLKSDIWSLGITMFEIIDKKLGVIKKLPSRFPTKRFPPPKVFNRMRDLWILILRCWDEKQERPQSWEVLEQIEMLIENPLGVTKESEGYITHVSSKGGYWDQMSGTLGDCSGMSPGFHDELSPCEIDSGSFQCDSPTSWLPEQESSDSMMSAMKTKLAKIPRMRIPGVRDKIPFRNRNNRSRRKRKDLETVTQDYLLPPSVASSKKSYGQKLKSLNYSMSSLDEPSIIFGGVYCDPLSISYKSEATNIKYCADRHFFNNSGRNLIENENAKACEYPNTPDSLTSSENPLSCELVTEEDNTPQKGIVLHLA